MLWEDRILVVALGDDEDELEGFEDDSELDLDDGEEFTDEDFEDDPDDDQRRRYYQLTPAGQDALRDEVSRLQGILDEARATRALGGT